MKLFYSLNGHLINEIITMKLFYSLNGHLIETEIITYETILQFKWTFDK